MHNPFGYILCSSDCPVDVIDNAGESRTDSDGSTGYGSIATPSTTAGASTLPVDDGHAGEYVSQSPLQTSVAFLQPPRVPLSPEPTVLLAEIQKAAEDVSQLVGRFGFKMAGTLQLPHVKAALFPDRSRLRLQSLRYADSFSCRLTKEYKKPVSLDGEAPLLWWLWDALLQWSTPSYTSNGCTLEFMPTYKTDIVLPCKIIIRLWSGNGVDYIELTAAYGGNFRERRIFDAPVARFRFPESGLDGVTATLAIDQIPYKDDGSFKDTFHYLLPRSGGIWHSAMNILPAKEKQLVQALGSTCKAKDDYLYMSEDNDSQCRNMILRLPPLARKFIEDRGLVGKERGEYSRSANGPPGPKD